MSGLNYKKFGSTLSNICNTTQLDDATKCHSAFKNCWGEPCKWEKLKDKSVFLDEIADDIKAILGHVFFFETVARHLWRHFSDTFGKSSRTLVSFRITCY